METLSFLANLYGWTMGKMIRVCIGCGADTTDRSGLCPECQHAQEQPEKDAVGEGLHWHGNKRVDRLDRDAEVNVEGDHIC